MTRSMVSHCSLLACRYRQLITKSPTLSPVRRARLPTFVQRNQILHTPSSGPRLTGTAAYSASTIARENLEMRTRRYTPSLLEGLLGTETGTCRQIIHRVQIR